MLPLAPSALGMAPGIALADANNFYCSCERVFRPDLAHRGVVVLGNNDGCIIARSNEAKMAGIPMGEALYLVKDLVRQHRITVCSANFALYGDMSARMMGVLGRFTPRLDMYSIDEAFLDLAHIPAEGWASHATNARETVYCWTGIPMSIGVGTSKTLAKLAAEHAKSQPGNVVSLDSPGDVRTLLAETPIEDVWGIGPARAKFLTAHDFKTAYDFAYRADPRWVRRRLTVVGARIQLELRGVACLPFTTERAAKQQIMCSRSFSQPITMRGDLKEAVALYSSWAAEKLRSQSSSARVVMVFVETNRFRKSAPQYQNRATVTLQAPTSDTLELAGAAIRALGRIFRPGFAYHKAGVILTRITPAEPRQLTLLDAPDPRRDDLMAVMDAINGRFGHDTIRVATAGTDQPWRMKQRARSPRYTTRWDEIAHVR
jgi:DNA polymerase V